MQIIEQHEQTVWSQFFRLWTSGLIATLFRTLCGSSVRLKGFEFDNRTKIFFANHSSNLDFPIIWANLPPILRSRTRPIAAEEYWLKGRIRRLLAVSGFRAILVHRGHASRENNPLERISEAVKGGDSVILFPEGTRSPSGELGHFKSGLYYLARDFPELDFVPVHLENMNRILPKGEYLLVPLLSTITFGTPLRIEANESKQAFLGRAEAALKELSV